MLERGHRGLRRIGERSQCSGRRERSTVVYVVGSMRHISVGTVTGGQSPGIAAVTPEVLWVCDAVCAINEGDVPVVVKIRFRETVVQAVRIETHERVVGEKQRPPSADADVELDPKISVSVPVMVAIRAPGPTFAIGDRPLRLSD